MLKAMNKKPIHLLPNVLTALGLTCGLFVIFKINMTPQGEAGLDVLIPTAGLLLLAAFFDLLDGAIARAIDAESEFGGLFDSLADAVSFGVAPSVIVLKSLSVAKGTPFSFLITTAALVFSVCGVMRLVRFSVQSKGGELAVVHQKNFTGLPIPAAAAAIVSLNLFLIEMSFDLKIWILALAMLVLGYFMISRWKFPSLKRMHFKVTSFQVVFATVLGAAFLFYGLLHHFSLVFFALSWAYLILAWMLSLIRVVAGRRSKTLEDFEPDDD